MEEYEVQRIEQKNRPLAVGDHIRIVSRWLVYGHHGIYIGNGKVIHYHDSYYRQWKAEVKVASLLEFTDKQPMANIRIVEYEDEVYSPEEVVKRARRRLGERKYSLRTNNCEHFATWCKTGKARSKQVERATVGVTVGAGGLLIGAAGPIAGVAAGAAVAVKETLD